MIRKLKMRFALTVLLLIAAILIALLSLLYYRISRTLYSDSLRALDYYSERSPSLLFSDKFEAIIKNDEFSHYNAFVLEYFPANHSVTPYGFERDITEEQKEYIFSLMNRVLASDDTLGDIDEYNIRYKVTEYPTFTKVAFVDREFEEQTLHKLLITFLFIAIGGLLSFFVIALLIAEAAISPIERSLKQQQQLIADVSHELKTPISIISANTEIISSHPDSTISEQQKWLSNISEETKRMKTLTESLLYLAKTDEGKSNIDKCDFDLSSAVIGATLPFESVCFEKGLNLRWNVEHNVMLYGNRELIKRIVTILLDNACKYSFKDTSVSVELRNDGDCVILAVNNKGEIISSENMTHIFERFYRTDTSRQSSSGSFGLGLAIAKTIVQQHGGEIKAFSDEKQGNTFVCSFIRKQTDAKNKKTTDA